MMRWYWKILGEHAHVRIYMNGALCGTCVFRVDEFNALRARQESEADPLIEFISATDMEATG